MPFEVGEVVMLKSGGPSMTVESLDDGFSEKDMKVMCLWFDNDQHIQEKLFRQDVLDYAATEPQE